MKLVPVTLGLIALSAVACASTPDAAPTAEAANAGTDSSEAEVRASCTNPRMYFVTLRDGSACKPITGDRGEWLPEPLFADAPADVQASTCTFRWSGERYSRPDRDAIRARVGYENGLAPSCGSSSSPEVGLLQPIPFVEDWTQAGSVGCDVCGVLKNGRVWVVLPPERIFRRQLQVGMSNGETRAFQIQPTNARALTIQLPPPPAGARYQGRVRVL